MAHHPQTDGQAPLTGALDVYLLDCRARRLSARSVSFYEWQLGRAIVFLAGRGVNVLADMTPTHIRAYLVALQERGLADNTVHAAARALRAWLNFCVREELLTVSPMSKVKMPQRGKAILPALSAADVRALLEACKGNRRDTAMVLCLLDSGLRAAEFVALNVADVDPITGAVKVRAGKGNKDRVSYVGARAHKALRRYLLDRPHAQPTDPLWVSLNTGDRLTRDGLRLALRRIGAAADVPHANPHTFRRTFALESLRAGMDLVRLAALMGHTDLAMLRRYLALVDSDLAQAHREHGPVDALLSDKGKGRTK